MRLVPAVNFRAAPYAAPLSINSRLLDSVAAAPFEGVWLPTMFAKMGGIELSGSMATLAVGLFGSNQFDPPVNYYEVTIGGSITVADVVTLVVNNPNLPGGSVSLAYTTVNGDSLTKAAAALAALIQGKAALAALGFMAANNSSAVIAISFPSVPPGQGAPDTLPPPSQNLTTISGSSNGSATETVSAAVGTNGTSLGASVTAFGFNSIAPVPRWIKARLTTLTGGGAAVTADFNGTA